MRAASWRIAIATTIAVLIAVTFAQKETITFWDNQQAESGLSQYQKTAVKEFEAANPNIKVNVVTVPYPEYQQRLTLAVQGGNAPDVSTVDQIWTAGFAASGAIMPLDQDVAATSSISKDKFFPGAWNSALYNGKVYGIPFNVDVWQFTYYNADILKAAGVNPDSMKTWAGLKAAGAKLTDRQAGKFGIGLFGHKGEDTVVVVDSFIYSNGGSVLHSDGTCALSDPPAVQALDYLKSLIPYAPSGILNNASGDMRQLFLNGSLATEWWPALEQPTLQKSKLNWNFVDGTAPAGKTPIGTYGGWNLVIYSQSKHKAAAWKFIQFLTRPDVNGKVVDLIPANIEAAKSFLQANRKGPERVMEQLQNARPRPLSAHYLQLSDIEQNMIQAIFNGTPTQTATEQACTKINALN